MDILNLLALLNDGVCLSRTGEGSGDASAVSVSWTDQEWVERILAGEARAFSLFYDRHAPALFRRMNRMLGDPNLAEDCLQHVFSEALRCMSSWRGDGKLEAWLERIATHTVMDQFRKKYRRRSFLERWWGGEEAATESQEGLPETSLFREETRKLVWEILEKVEPKKRMAVLLCDLEGHTLEEAARQMQAAVGTTASRLRYGREEFKRLATAEFRRRGLSLGDCLDG